ncbi:hypothetical protein [Hoylesella timonensis]|uniref:hypothetical protein n=1 Tax=Hoylesella timonensis TaxID=386414 RepID=UPI001898F632|nr:hypothetical protein [Hoylesella timonensis]
MKKIMFNDKFLLTQAVLNGTKTMTRRLLKVPKTCNGKEVYSFNILTNNAGTQCVDLVDENEVVLGSWKPHYEVGEVVAIAQSYKEVYPNADFEMVGDGFMKESSGWTNKMFVKADLMPHHIIITDVKVERLQDITNEDCLKEGVWQFCYDKDLFYVSKDIGYADTVAFPSSHEAFWYLINKICGKDTWERNPWVEAYTFETVD